MRIKSSIVSGLLLALVACSVSSCGGGSGGGSGDDVSGIARGGADSANFNCGGDCPNQNLSEGDVTRILQQAIAGAQSLGVAATIVVIDRPANVLAAYQMPGAALNAQITSGGTASGGVEGAIVPSVFCSISKAGTSSYFSSQGNAFTTRTANQVLQENYLPSESFQPSGPLF